jgi:predicted Rossmann fold nucleotide-binding protein DprA/Smf involved in DNA uptake
VKRSQLVRVAGTTSGAVYALGDGALLGFRRLGLICSRRCSGDVILKTYDFARLVRTPGLAVVSGFHSRIEKDCLPILLRGSGQIIIVQGHRLSTTRLPLDWQIAIDAGRLLLISPFRDKQKRVTTELAVERNRFVAAISDEVLIPHAAPGSKTETLFRELIASGKRVYTFESSSNASMISSGAIAIAPDFFAQRPSKASATV